MEFVRGAINFFARPVAGLFILFVELFSAIEGEYYR